MSTTTTTDPPVVLALLDKIGETLAMWPTLTPRTRLFAALNLQRRTTELVAVLEAREGR